MKTLVIQSYRAENVPGWIARCMASVQAWAAGRGYDYLLTDDRAFGLCGPEYLARVGGNVRSITNLCRLELLRQAHRDGYARAVWMDADVFVFDPASLSINAVSRIGFARETFLWRINEDRWRAFSSINNCTVVCMRDEPDLDFLIAATRHVALHRAIQSNYQVGGQLIKGLRASLQFETLDDIGMLSHFTLMAIAHGVDEIARAQARLHGNPIHAANLCASENYEPAITGQELGRTMDRLEQSRGGVINRWLEGWSRPGLNHPYPIEFKGPDVLARRAGHAAAPTLAAQPPAPGTG